MAIGQAQFDADLQTMITAWGQTNANLAALISAIQAFLALPPVIDLTNEDQTVNAAATQIQAAAAAAAAETAKIPPPPPPPPGP